MAPGQVPLKLSRLDVENWTPTPTAIESRLTASLDPSPRRSMRLLVLDQVDEARTGGPVTGATACAGRDRRGGQENARDRRRSPEPARWPPVSFKMNAAELASLLSRGPGCFRWTTSRRPQPRLRPGTAAGLRHALGTRDDRRGFPRFRRSRRRTSGPRSHRYRRCRRLPSPPTSRPHWRGCQSPRSQRARRDCVDQKAIHQLGTTGTASVQENLPTLAGPARSNKLLLSARCPPIEAKTRGERGSVSSCLWGTQRSVPEDKELTPPTRSGLSSEILLCLRRQPATAFGATLP